MTEALIALLTDLSAQDVTINFVNTIAVATVICLFFYWLGFFKKLTAYAPSLLTSVGILGTFTGIIIGLMGFDASSSDTIDKSISALLDGLKTAFITSLFGMAAAILYKVLTSITPSGMLMFRKSSTSAAEVDKDATGDDLLQAIEQGNEQQATQQTAQQQELEKLNKALTGEGDSSLSTLIGKQRLENREFNEALCTRLDSLQNTNQSVAERLEKQDVQLTEGISAFNNTAQQQLEVLEHIGQGMSLQEARFERFATDLEQQLKGFAEMLSKSATEQMIEALKNVIAEFNDTLTEQFGENFKALDASVKKMVDWQENYKEQLGEMRAQFDLSVKALADSEQAVSYISQSAATIPETMSGMQKLLEISRHQIDDLERHLGAFVVMRDKAVDAVPQMQQQVEASVKDVTQAATTASEHYQTLLNDSDRYIKQHNESVADFLARFTTTTDESTAKLREQMLESAGELKTTLSEGTTSIGQELQRQSGELERHFSTSSQGLEKSAQSLTEATESFSKETQAMLEQLKQGGLDTSKQIETIQLQVKEGTEEMQKRLTQSFEDIVETQTKQMNEAYQQMAELINNARKQGSDTILTQVDVLDKSMQDEINRVMKTMGEALVQITGRFTEDYRSLTAQMQKVVSSVRDEEIMS